MKRIVATFFCLIVVAAAQAGPLDEKKTEVHLQAIAAGDVEALMRDYREGAFLDWIGGPLDGRYRGKAAIREVWKKWVAANGGMPRTVRFGKIEQQANPNGTTLQARAEYSGKTSVKVWHVLVYREGELATEIWQIAPKMKLD